MFSVRKILLLFGLTAFSLPVLADMFIYETPDGSRMLTDHLLSDPGYRLIRTGLAKRDAGEVLAGNKPRAFRANPRAYDKLIARMAKAHDVDGGLIKAVIYVESRFNPYAMSIKGAAGLMQLMPATADRYGVSNVYDPAQNVEAGVLHLKYLLKRYRNKRLAIAAYNAGAKSVDQYQGVPPYSETRKYVRRVLRYSKMYKKEFRKKS